MKRHSPSLRRKTIISQANPHDVIPKAASFVLHLWSLQICHKYLTDNIFTMDKTECWMDMSSNTTVALTGSCIIPLTTTSHEKDHFTVILTAKANSTKLKPHGEVSNKSLVLFVVRFSNNDKMNHMLTIDYLPTLYS